MSNLIDTYMARSFSSFSGADIRATFAGIEIGTLQAISYAIQREKAPIYTLGKADPRAFSRGKRGIAGTMIFVMFDDHALLSAFEEDAPQYMKFVKDRDEISPSLFDPGDNTPTPDPLASANDWDSWGVANAYYVDQIPPFDVTVTGVNETGAGAVLRIWGVEILNEGYGISIDDMVSEVQTTYVARSLSRWKKPESFPYAARREGAGTVVTGPSE